jgi:hypothetical protein
MLLVGDLRRKRSWCATNLAGMDNENDGSDRQITKSDKGFCVKLPRTHGWLNWGFCGMGGSGRIAEWHNGRYGSGNGIIHSYPWFPWTKDPVQIHGMSLRGHGYTQKVSTACRLPL